VGPSVNTSGGSYTAYWCIPISRTHKAEPYPHAALHTAQPANHTPHDRVQAEQRLKKIRSIDTHTPTLVRLRVGPSQPLDPSVLNAQALATARSFCAQRSSSTCTPSFSPTRSLCNQSRPTFQETAQQTQATPLHDPLDHLGLRSSDVLKGVTPFETGRCSSLRCLRLLVCRGRRRNLSLLGDGRLSLCRLGLNR